MSRNFKSHARPYRARVCRGARPAHPSTPRYKLLGFCDFLIFCARHYTYYLGIANYEQFQRVDLAMIIIGGLGSILGSILGVCLVTLLPIVTRWFLVTG